MAAPAAAAAADGAQAAAGDTEVVCVIADIKRVLVDPGSAARLLLSESDLADGFYFEVLLFVDGTTETCVLHPKLNKLVLTGALRRGSHAAIGSWETRQDETVEDPVMFSVITELRAAHDMGLCTVVAATLKARPVSSPRRYYLDVFCDDLSDVRHWLRGDEELFVGAGSLEEADFKQSHTTLSKLRSAGTRGTFEDSIVCGFVVARSRLVHFGTPKSNGSAAFLLNLTISDEAGVVMPVVLWNSQAALYYKTLPGSVIAIRGFRVQRSAMTKDWELSVNVANPRSDVRILERPLPGWLNVPTVSTPTFTPLREAFSVTLGGAGDRALVNLVGVVAHVSGLHRARERAHPHRLYEYCYVSLVEPGSGRLFCVQLTPNSSADWAVVTNSDVMRASVLCLIDVELSNVVLSPRPATSMGLLDVPALDRRVVTVARLSSQGWLYAVKCTYDDAVGPVRFVPIVNSGAAPEFLRIIDAAPAVQAMMRSELAHKRQLGSLQYATDLMDSAPAPMWGCMWPSTQLSLSGNVRDFRRLYSRARFLPMASVLTVGASLLDGELFVCLAHCASVFAPPTIDDAGRMTLKLVGLNDDRLVAEVMNATGGPFLRTGSTANARKRAQWSRRESSRVVQVFGAVGVTAAVGSVDDLRSALEHLARFVAVIRVIPNVVAGTAQFELIAALRPLAEGEARGSESGASDDDDDDNDDNGNDAARISAGAPAAEA